MARRVRVRARQPEVQRYDPRLEAEAEESEKKNGGGTESGRVVQPAKRERAACRTHHHEHRRESDKNCARCEDRPIGRNYFPPRVHETEHSASRRIFTQRVTR